jgi:hypothetical protein
MSTTMPPTTPPATPSSPDPGRSPRAGAPRWAWALIAILAVIAIVAATVAITGRDSGDDTAAAPPPTGRAADGCLGGIEDLDEALLTAQREAPLTSEGAAAFVATFNRWAIAAPLPADKAATAGQILAEDVTDDARQAARVFDPKGTTSRADFSNGRYYVESFAGDTAIVSWTASAVATRAGQELPVATIGGAAHLTAVDGVWRYADQSLARPLEEIRRLGRAYVGGC